MKKILKFILSQLEKRFPDKVVVTEADYQILKATVDKLAKESVTEERIKKIEAEISKFNVSLGFMGGRTPFQR